jgi:hypothetical protein
MNRDITTIFSEDDIADTRPEMKIGLLATVDPHGFPHVTLLSSLMACSPTRLSFGQFVEGLSKKYILNNPKTCFFIMDLRKNLWRGTATYAESAKEGPQYDHYNNVPMFRYNAYMGVHTVHYFDLVEHTGKTPLPMGRIVFAALKTAAARTLGKKDKRVPIMNEWTRAFVSKMGNLKFISYIAGDGYPRIIPAIQTQSFDARRLIFSPCVYKTELEAIPEGTSLAVFCMALSMEDVLLRGVYRGIRRAGGFAVGVIDIDWVYNSMPPVPGQVYPPIELKPVSFAGAGSSNGTN